ncbi:MAG TPA: hypothetical protein VK788_19440 [Terriglobales bacterium]|nr:hypothetical protein [Terriglobales bacterium]
MQTHRPDRRRQVQVSATVAVGWHHLGRRRSRNHFWFVFIERGVAAAAKIVTGTELNQ